jgi:hypothetical protein
MIFWRFFLLVLSVVLLSMSTASLVEFFECTRPLYDSAVWNHSQVQKYNNCYIYALNRPKTSRTQKTSPGLGQNGGGDKGTANMYRDYNIYTCDYFDQLIKNDIPGAVRMNHIQSAGQLTCPNNYYEAALVLDDDGTPYNSDEDDFHFYRKDCGTNLWSHKPGSAPVTKLDASGQYITDPKTSDRNFPNHNYYKFCGYYCVPHDESTYKSTKKELGLD